MVKTILYHILTRFLETQCIPTPLAWYAHNLPVEYHFLSNDIMFYIEILMPFLTFVPSRLAHLYNDLGQIMLQILIIATGNYNFFNLLTITLCFSLIDDTFLLHFVSKKTQTFFEGGETKESTFSNILGILVRIY